MKRISILLGALIIFFTCTYDSCDNRPENTSAKDEQAHTEINQRRLSAVQPPPDIPSTVPLTFTKPVNRLAIINTDEARKALDASKAAMKKQGA